MKETLPVTTTAPTPLNWQLREKLSILLRFTRSTSSPRWGAIFVTQNCNLDCNYCQVPTKHPMPDLPTQEWKLIIDRLAKWGLRAATIVGGEPTSRADLPEIVAHLRKNDILPCLISNFARLDRTWINDLAQAGLFSLQASVDSLRGRGRGNRRWLDLLEDARGAGILPLVSTVVTSRNVDELPDLAEETTGRGMVYNCSLYQEVGGVFSVIVPDYKPPRDKLLSAFREIEAIKRRTHLVRTTFKYLRNVDRFYSSGLWRCDPMNDYWINVNADGTLMPCQEYESPIHVLEITSLEDERWRQIKESKSRSCKGCYYQCYFEQETSNLSTIFEEAGPILAGWNLLSDRSPTR